MVVGLVTWQSSAQKPNRVIEWPFEYVALAPARICFLAELKCYPSGCTIHYKSGVNKLVQAPYLACHLC